jgi:DNA-binding SARP family transcriptional activator
MLELSLLGAPRIAYQGKVINPPPPKTFAMLCYLALKPEGASRRELAELLWGPDKTGSVRVALTELRKLPEAGDWLIADDQLVKVDVVTDVLQFEKALDNDDYASALSACGDNQPFLHGLELRNADPFLNWLELERSRLSELYLSALQGRIGELEKHQHFTEAIKLAKSLLEQDKLNEDIHRAVIRLEHKRGNDEAALAQFEILRQILKQELGEEPLEETLELLREIEGASISSAKAALVLKDANSIPNLTSKLFGRENLLGDIQTHIKKQEQILLQGLGGSGKTALAAAAAAQHLQHKQTKVLWLQAGDDDPDALFDAIARALESRQFLNQTKDKTKTIQDLLKQHKITLVVLDDVWNAYGLSKVMEALPSIAFIATSRQRYPKLKRLDVGRLPREAAIQLLLHHAILSPSPLLPLSPSDLEEEKGDRGEGEICNLLGDHAFAVRIAGITLAVDGISPKGLLERIKDAPHVLKIPAEFTETGRESMTSLLSVSLAALSDEAHEALLAFGALFSSSATSELLSLCTRRSEDITENALAELQKRGLADRVTEAGSDVISYRLHDLVFSFAKANNNLRASTAVKANKALLDKRQHDFDVLDAEINNVLGAVDVAKKTDMRLFVDMMRQLVVGNAYYHARGHSPRSFELLKVAVEKAKEIGDLEAAHYLIARMGDAYREFYGDSDRALEVFEEALKLAQQLNNTERETIMLGLIGIVRFNKGEAASTFFEAAYRLAEEQKNDLLLGHIAHYKGFIALSEEHWQEASHWSKEAIRFTSLALTAAPETKETNTTLFFSLLNLGESEKMLRRLPEALEVRQTALQLAKKQKNVLWVGYALEGIAEIHHELGEQAKAQDHYQRALELFYENNALSDMDMLIQTMRDQGYKVKKEELVLA